MRNRILAWAALVGFVLLVINIMTYQKWLEASVSVYIIIVAWFLLTHRKQKK